MIYRTLWRAEQRCDAGKNTRGHQCVTPGRMPIQHLDMAALGDFLEGVMTHAAGMGGEQKHSIQTGITQLTANLPFQVFVKKANIKVDVMTD